jgi:hypothetical protein
MPRIVLINDTSLYASHFGCQLVGQTFREQLVRTGMELIAAFPRQLDMKIAKPYLDQADLVIINAEGTFHRGRHCELLRLARQWPCVLVNGVFQDNGRQPDLGDFLYISMRESLSAWEVRKQKVRCHVVPDLLFGSTMLRATPSMERVTELGITDNVINHMSGFQPQSELAHDVISKIARCQKLCAGRFHAAIAAAVLQVPFSTWDSNTWKTEGLMLDMGVQHLHFESQLEAINNTPDVMDPRIEEYVSDAPDRIQNMFDTLARIAQRQSGRSGIRRAA